MNSESLAMESVIPANWIQRHQKQREKHQRTDFGQGRTQFLERTGLK
jgi:hypothetical protein